MKLSIASFLVLLVVSPFGDACVAQVVGPPQQQEQQAAQPSRAEQQLGVEFAVAQSKIRRAIIRTKTPYGFAVKDVAKGSLAEQAGLAKGTIVLEVNGKPFEQVAELEAVLAKAKPGEKIELLTAARKSKRRLLDRKPWVEKKVEIRLPKPDPKDKQQQDQKKKKIV